MAAPVRRRLRSSVWSIRRRLIRNETRALTGSADVEGAHARLDLVARPVLVRVWKIRHLLKRHNLDPELVLVLIYHVLRIVGTVEVDAAGVLTRTSMVPADDEMSCAVIFPDDGVPQGFAWSAHAHRQRQQCKHRHAVRVARKKCLIDTHPREVVNVTRLGQADDGMDEHVGLARPCGTHGQLTVGAMHGIARGLKTSIASRELGQQVTESGRQRLWPIPACRNGDEARRANLSGSEGRDTQTPCRGSHRSAT